MNTHFDIIDRRAQVTKAVASAVVVAAAAIAISVAILGVIRISSVPTVTTHVSPAVVTDYNPVLLETVVVRAPMPIEELTVTQLAPVVVHAQAPVSVSIAQLVPRQRTTLVKTRRGASRPLSGSMPYPSFGATMTR